MKNQIISDYISLLHNEYPQIYADDAAVKRATKAAQAALAGEITLKGDCWTLALKMNGIKPNISRAQLKALVE